MENPLTHLMCIVRIWMNTTIGIPFDLLRLPLIGPPTEEIIDGGESGGEVPRILNANKA